MSRDPNRSDKERRMMTPKDILFLVATGRAVPFVP
jgi:hypothetical protein